VLSQYLSCLEGWRSAHVVKRGLDWFWDVEDARIGAHRPSRARTGEDQ
jgi:hypothetical protein